jgi:hypothetical protein
MFFRLPRREVTVDLWLLWRVFLHIGLYTALLTPGYSSYLELRAFWPMAKYMDVLLSYKSGVWIPRHLLQPDLSFLILSMVTVLNLVYLQFILGSMALLVWDSLLDWHYGGSYEKMSYPGRRMRWISFILSSLHIILSIWPPVLIYAMATGDRPIPRLPHLMNFLLILSDPILRLCGVAN